jgi:hypothetical protein
MSKTIEGGQGQGHRQGRGQRRGHPGSGGSRTWGGSGTSTRVAASGKSTQKRLGGGIVGDIHPRAPRRGPIAPDWRPTPVLALTARAPPLTPPAGFGFLAAGVSTPNTGDMTGTLLPHRPTGPYNPRLGVPWFLPRFLPFRTTETQSRREENPGKRNGRRYSKGWCDG